MRTTTALNLLTGSMLGLLFVSAVVTHQGVSLVYISTQTPATRPEAGADRIPQVSAAPAIYSPTGPDGALIDSPTPGPVGGKQPGAVVDAARGAVLASPVPGDVRPGAVMHAVYGTDTAVPAPGSEQAPALPGGSAGACSTN